MINTSYCFHQSGQSKEICLTMYSNNHYNKSLKNFAQVHRNESTKAEIRLWVEVLSKKQMFGYQFLRQRPIDNFIVDFFCKPLKFAIEVDGYTHDFDEIYQKDLKKKQRLQELGYFVIRFRDEEIINEIGRVKEIIAENILRINRRHPPNPPSPKHIPPRKGDKLSSQQKNNNKGSDKEK